MAIPTPTGGYGEKYNVLTLVLEGNIFLFKSKMSERKNYANLHSTVHIVINGVRNCAQSEVKS